MLFFMGIDGCRFRRKVDPGECACEDGNLEIPARSRIGAGVWKFRGRATVEGELAAEAEFSAMMDLQG